MAIPARSSVLTRPRTPQTREQNFRNRQCRGHREEMLHGQGFHYTEEGSLNKRYASEGSHARGSLAGVRPPRWAGVSVGSPESRHTIPERLETRRQEMEQQRSLTLQAVDRLTIILILVHPDREVPTSPTCTPIPRLRRRRCELRPRKRVPGNTISWPFLKGLDFRLA